MFTVMKKPLTPNTLWDSAKGEVLCKFEKGKLETNNEELVTKLKNMGYEVTGEPEKEDAEPQTPSEPTDDKNPDDSDNQNDAEPEKEEAKPKRRSRKAAEK